MSDIAPLSTDREALTVALKSLPVTMRRIVLMRLADELSIDEIAAVLSLPAAVVARKYVSAIYTLQLAKDKTNAERGRHNGQLRQSIIVDGVELFFCTQCKAWIPRDGYHAWSNPKSACGVRAWCKSCDNAARRARGR